MAGFLTCALMVIAIDGPVAAQTAPETTTADSTPVATTVPATDAPPEPSPTTADTTPAPTPTTTAPLTTDAPVAVPTGTTTTSTTEPASAVPVSAVSVSTTVLAVTVVPDIVPDTSSPSTTTSTVSASTVSASTVSTSTVSTSTVSTSTVPISTTTTATTTTTTTTTTTVATGPDPCLTGCDLGTGLLFHHWHFEQLGVATPPTIAADGVLVAVVDRGVRLDHQDLVGNVRRAACSPAFNAELELEHGTNVAGLIAPISFDGRGLASAVPGIEVLDVPIAGLDDEGRSLASAALVAAGIRCAVAEGADIINLSVAGSCTGTDDLRAAVLEAEQAGVVVVAAAGNVNSLAPPCPAAFPTVLSVGATSQDGAVVIGEQWADILLPGVELVTASASDSRPRTLVTGTSFAAPVLSSTIAALLSEHPKWTPARVRARISIAATDNQAWLPALMADRPGAIAVTSDGGVTSLGDAAIAAELPTAAAVDLAVGLCFEVLVASADGGVFALGGAQFHGSLGGIDLAAPIVSIEVVDGGYLLFAADGGVFTFGAAEFFGSLGAIAIGAPIVDAAVTSTGRGYWLLGADGQIYTFGDAAREGSIVDPTGNMVAIERIDGGYVLFRSDGQVVRFGSRLQSWNFEATGSVIGGYVDRGDPVVVMSQGEVVTAGDASRLVGSPTVVAAARAPTDIECSDQQ